MSRTPPRILSIAGSDSSGGAGIQADIKTITMLSGYAMTAITAVTAQNTIGVQGITPIAGEFVLEQIASCIDDIGADAIKIGMLGNEDIVRHVAAALVAAPEVSARSAAGHIAKNAPPATGRFPIVLDPVMVATSGARLIDEAAISAMRARLFPLATLLTPNLPELELLAGRELRTLELMQDAAGELAREAGCDVLAKGGHTDDERVIDVLVSPMGEAQVFHHRRLSTPHTHGSGCTLSSAIATLIGHGQPLEDAIRIARKFVYSAMENAPGFGLGSGPMGHQAVRNTT
ncbi:hydroxymethylpyrimidine/phosphomethylpyrimidine kinase [Allopontixanthobacter sp.]|uniref:bifunctional hydroxymethylpyrimidine kinase/phosphomethylpyrimidine kinase n=1 Tax=Allopontixanthobacter sp. TaxID=2906452 RepID=UPI002ABB765E|nr:hydroxymethylpyrimidine/phosphomethylpyrimidine kinase [Allopontixanthobacter sp.]MDZ4307625.1 hydroxymethylpyrimidine/phosphomethylpyrimidine kinase [Allopontixanthobacter sp.]